MNLFLVRHQKTQWNIEGRLQGRDDSQDIIIDKSFLEEVNSNLVMLNSIPFDVVVSSPQKRARQTTEAYGFTEYKVDENIMEYDFGRWEGHFKKELLSEHNDLWFSRFTQFSDGEPFDCFSFRLDTFLDAHKNFQNVLVFTHGVVCRYFVQKINVLDLNTMNSLDISNNKILSLEV